MIKRVERPRLGLVGVMWNVDDVEKDGGGGVEISKCHPKVRRNRQATIIRKAVW